ncbi:MAG: hypothetical protein ABR962_08895 [Candidatus Bathyarchaeia archaeon]|jgi:hypothetical protein
MTEGLSEREEFWMNLRGHRDESQQRLNALETEFAHVNDLYEECRNLWITGNFIKLSQVLDKEGFAGFDELSERLPQLNSEIETLHREIEKIDTDLKNGVACPRCESLGEIVVEKSYERSDGQIIPTMKTQKCSLCRGSGRLRPMNK